MSNHSSCIFILTKLIGFAKSDNDEKMTLSDQVEIDTLIQIKNFLQDNIINSKLNNKSFWPCNHCTYHNPIDLNKCQMCASPRNPWTIFLFRQKLGYVLFL